MFKAGLSIILFAVNVHKHANLQVAAMYLLGLDSSCCARRGSQLVAVDVVFKHALLHAVTHLVAEGTHSVAALVLLQLAVRYAGEALVAVATHQDDSLRTEMDMKRVNRCWTKHQGTTQ